MFRKANLGLVVVTVMELLAVSGSALADELHVPVPYGTIQAAIDDANDEDVVVVADGTYAGAGNRNIDFGGRAITVRSENGPEDCIIDCQALGRGFYFHSGEDEDSVINGFTITNGAQGPGAGIYCRDSSNPIIENCVFSSNDGGSRGGGAIGTSYSASPTINNCLFVGNTAKYGGAISCSHGTVRISNCIFIGNSGQYCGGVRTHTCTATVKNCMFISNSAESGGGLQVIYTDLNLSNCTIYGNSAETYGGGISVSVDSVGVIKNCIFWLNTAVEGSEIANKFFSSAPYPSSVSVYYSNIRGGKTNVYVSPECALYWGGGNIDANPRFKDADNNDFHLLPDSTCINSGDPSHMAGPNEKDLDGNRRVVDGRIDMGAYEFIPQIEVPMMFTPQALNTYSHGKYVKAHFVLPEGYMVEDVDTNTPAFVEQGNIQSEYIDAFINEDNLVEIVASFDRGAFCGIGNGDMIDIRVVGSFTDGKQFYGTDTIKIITDNLEYLAVLASHWLQAGCGKPDWCSGLDLDQDSVVNFVDFAVFDGCGIEIAAE